MSKILGIDVGTNSIGWALIDDEEKKVIKTGARIFEEGVEKKSRESKNLARRTARGARRRNYRFKLRRNRLKTVLKELGMSPDKTYYTSDKGDKKYLTYKLYELRKRALEEKISLAELGRIFLHINAHRGFKSNKKEEDVFAEDKKKKSETGVVKEAIAELQSKIDEAKENGKINHGTLGEYCFYLIESNKEVPGKNEPIVKIRGDKQYTHRNMYAYEFDKIWEKQKEYYPELLTEENKKKIKDETIFFQRNLRSQKHLVGKCKYEFTEYKDTDGKIKRSYLTVCPKSSFEFQEYRIWEQVNRLRLIDNARRSSELTDPQKQILVDALHDAVTLSHKKALKLLDLDPKQWKFNDLPDPLKGNVTRAKLRNALGAEFWDSLDPEQGADNEVRRYSEDQMMLWHNIQFASDFVEHSAWLKGDIP